MGAPEDSSPLVRLTGITKRFGPVTVLRDVHFEGLPGQVHVLAGENGAGKSTLVKILGGIHTDYEGRIEIQGRPARPRSPLEAATLGVAVIHQELSLIGPMSVADNVFLGRTPSRAGFVRQAAQNDAARHWLRQLGLEIDVRQPVDQFPVAIRQLIEIAKALSQNARVIVMDEPTSALNAPEVNTLFGLIHSLKARGCCIIYITHKMEEIERIADRITVLRDGQCVGSAAAAELPPAKLIQWMVGRDLGEQFPRHTRHRGAELLRLENFSVFPSGFSSRAAVDKISLSIRAGEVLGLGGLQGSGASELFLGLFWRLWPRHARANFFGKRGKPLRFAAPGHRLRRRAADQRPESDWFGAVNVGLRKRHPGRPAGSFARRLAAARARTGGGRSNDGADAPAGGVAGHRSRGAFRREPAEGGAGQMPPGPPQTPYA